MKRKMHKCYNMKIIYNHAWYDADIELNLSTQQAASTSVRTLMSIGATSFPLIASATFSTRSGAQESRRCWTKRTFFHTRSESCISMSCIFLSFAAEVLLVYQEMTSSLNNKWSIGSKMFRLNDIAPQMLTNDGTNTPSSKNGPMNPVMFRVNRNGRT